jgi:CDP-diacylglycerol---glycerol-3-phosphate 3-phosphatidyltransferase
MVTIASAAFGVGAGVLLCLGRGWPAALVAAVSQVLDGVDGQLARKTGRASRAGAFLDSVLDRYADAAMVVGTTVYGLRLGGAVPAAVLVAVGALALAGSGAISYTSARAAELGIDLGRPTLASKGTRMTAMTLGALGSLLWQPLPIVALVYVAVHSNLAVGRRVVRAARTAGAAHMPGPGGR